MVSLLKITDIKFAFFTCYKYLLLITSIQLNEQIYSFMSNYGIEICQSESNDLIIINDFY